MQASIGDHLVGHSTHVDAPVRDGEILEVPGGGCAPPYVVRWSDDDFVWPFWIVVCYAGRRPLRQNYVDLDVRIESASMTDLFQDLVRCVCARLRPQARRRIASDLRQRRIWFDPPIADANVLERLVSP